jgi:hypothetical protein
MDTNGLSELRLTYKRAVSEWINAIRAEESLATTNHSMTAMESGTTRTSKSRVHKREPNRRGMRTRVPSVKRTMEFEPAHPTWASL